MFLQPYQLFRQAVVNLMNWNFFEYILGLRQELKYECKWQYYIGWCKRLFHSFFRMVVSEAALDKIAGCFRILINILFASICYGKM